MKKRINPIVYSLFLITSLVGCNNNVNNSTDISNDNSHILQESESSSLENSSIDSSKSESESSTVSESTTIFDEDMYYKEEVEDPHYHSYYDTLSSPKEDIEKQLTRYLDDKSNLTLDEVNYGELYINGLRQESLNTSYSQSDDSYLMFYGNGKARAISKANGYALTLPSDKIIKPDLSVAQYKTQFEAQDYILSISKEDKNTYASWDTYHTEWITRYLVADGDTTSTTALNNFFKYNNLSYTREPGYSFTLLSSFEVEYISILINDNENIEMPYYNIAIIKKPSEIKNFYLLVMKSKTDMSSQFDSIISTMKFFNTYGKARGNQDFQLKVPTYLNEETQKYYKKLINQNYTEWGIFNHS